MSIKEEENKINTEEYKEFIEDSISNLLKLQEERKQELTSTLLFTKEKNKRYILKSKYKKYFDIFPWILERKKDGFRYRESVNSNKGSSIEDVVESIQYFISLKFNQKDIELLKSIYRSYYVKEALFWPIIKVRNDFELKRKDNFTEELRQQITIHHERIEKLEEDVRDLHLKYSHSNKKRKFSSVDDDILAILQENSEKISTLEELVRELKEAFKYEIEERQYALQNTTTTTTNLQTDQYEPLTVSFDDVEDNIVDDIEDDIELSNFGESKEV